MNGKEAFIDIKLLPDVSLSDIQDAGPACGGEDINVFYPVGEKSKEDREKIAKARKICLGCEALLQCRNYALKHKQEFGIWGGMTESERRHVWRQQRRHSA